MSPESRIIQVLEQRGPCRMSELMRRLGNVDGRTSGPTIRRMIADGRLKARTPGFGTLEPV